MTNKGTLLDTHARFVMGITTEEPLELKKGLRMIKLLFLNAPNQILFNKIYQKSVTSSQLLYFILEKDIYNPFFGNNILDENK